MKKRLTKWLLVGCLCAWAMSSCNGSDTDDIYEHSLGQCLTYGQNLDTQAQNFNKISFDAQYNYSTHTVDLSIVGMVVPVAGNANGIAYPKMAFKNLPWSYNEYGWKVIEADGVSPEITGMATVPFFEKLKFDLVDSFNGDSYAPGIMYDFSLSNSTSSFRLTGCCLTGTTEATSPDGAQYSPENDGGVSVKPAYWLDIDFATKKVDLYLYSAKFLANMPSLNLVFPDVPFTVENGEMKLAISALTPEYDGIPNPGFPISKLEGSFEPSTGLTLEFHCAYRGEDYTVKFSGKY